MNFVKGNDRRKASSSVYECWTAHAKTFTLFVSVETQKLFSHMNLLCVIQNGLKCNTVWELNGPFAIMNHEDRVSSSTDGVKLSAERLDTVSWRCTGH